MTEEIRKEVANIICDAIGSLNHTHIGYSSEHDYLVDPYVNDIVQLFNEESKKSIKEL